MAPLPDTKLVIVTGKGGVGRSTVAAALATRLAAEGRTALLHPKAGTPAAPPATTDHAAPEVRAIDRDAALEIYMSEQLPAPLAATLRASRAFRLLAAATPGLAELITIGELKRLSDSYDHLVFDAPATGHILAMFDAPGRFERAAAAGPIARRAGEFGSWLRDPAVCSTIIVTTGDGLAVSELLELSATLQRASGRAPALIVGNRVLPSSPSASELDGASALAGVTAGAAETLTRLAARSRSERAQLARITRSFGRPPLQIPERPDDPCGAALEVLDGLSLGAAA